MSNLTNQTIGSFDKKSKIQIGNKIYIVERHFSGSRDVKTAVFTVVKK